MADSGRSRADENRTIRQDALREQLSNKGLLQQAIEISEKLSDLTTELDSLEAKRLKDAADLKLKMVNKYLGDVRAVEVSGHDGGPVKLAIGWNED